MDEMPYEEFLAWCAYFEERPPGWQEDNRTFKLLQAQGFKGNPEDIFQSLGKVFKQREVEHVDGMLKHPQLTGTSFLDKLKKAKGGEQLNVSQD